MGNEKQKIEADKAREAIEQKSINTIRTLSMDAVQAANSGHPGTAMALAPVAYTLWNDQLRFDPEDPIWPNRDRFVLSVACDVAAARSRQSPTASADDARTDGVDQEPGR